MKLNSRVKPSKPASLIGAITGFLFAIFGIVFLSVVSQEQGFMDDGGSVILVFFILFIMICLAITIFYLANFFSKKGISMLDVDIEKDMNDIGGQDENKIESRLIKLESLKDKGLITVEEYQQKKTEILKEV